MTALEQRTYHQRRLLELRRAARAALEPWIAYETAPGRRARDRALDDVSRAMVALAAELDRRGT